MEPSPQLLQFPACEREPLPPRLVQALARVVAYCRRVKCARGRKKRRKMISRLHRHETRLCQLADRIVSNAQLRALVDRLEDLGYQLGGEEFVERFYDGAYTQRAVVIPFQQLS